MSVAPFKLLGHERNVTTICAAVIGATFVAGLVASAARTHNHERPGCRDHRRAAVAEAPLLGCADPVAGTWVAEEYRSEHGDWVEHTLHISTDADTYVVDHTSRLRQGDHRGPAAFHCAPSAFEFDTVGRATLRGDHLHVWGDGLVETRARCDGQSLGYALDSFTGTLSGDTFTSVNNDGATAVNVPYRFRRLSCGDTLPPPNP